MRIAGIVYLSHFMRKPTMWFSHMQIVGFLVQRLIMPPTLKKLEGHIAFGLSVCVCVR